MSILLAIQRDKDNQKHTKKLMKKMEKSVSDHNKISDKKLVHYATVHDRQLLVLEKMNNVP